MSKNFEIKVQFRIEAARKLTKLPKSHPCSQLHGHSFVLTLTLFGPWDEHLGWLRDYHEIETKIRPILNMLDHHYLNEVPGLENPTSEVLCVYLFDKIKPLLPELQKVTVAETPTTECSYSPST
jgi:6-pyruvoyltetrahydropterin/6-carboxytetrahydropterin synthase